MKCPVSVMGCDFVEYANKKTAYLELMDGKYTIIVIITKCNNSCILQNDNTVTLLYLHVMMQETLQWLLSVLFQIMHTGRQFCQSSPPSGDTAFSLRFYRSCHLLKQSRAPWY